MNRAAALLDPRLRPCPLTVNGAFNPLISRETMRADLWRLALQRLREHHRAGHQVRRLTQNEKVWQNILTRIGTAQPEEQNINLQSVQRELTGTITPEQASLLMEFAGKMLSPPGEPAWHEAQNLAEQLMQANYTSAYTPSNFYLLKGEDNPDLMGLLHDTPEREFNAALDGLAAQLAWHLGLTAEQQLTRLSLNPPQDSDHPDVQAQRELLSDFMTVQGQVKLATLRGENPTALISSLNLGLRTHHAILVPEMIPNLPGIRGDIPMGLRELRDIPEVMAALSELGVTEANLIAATEQDLKATWQTGLHWGSRHDTNKLALSLMRGLPLHAWLAGEQADQNWLAAQLCADLKTLKSGSAPEELAKKLKQSLSHPRSVAQSLPRLSSEDQGTLARNVTVVAGQRRNSSTAHLLSLLSTDHEQISAYLQWSNKIPYDVLLEICEHHPRVMTGMIRLLLKYAGNEVPSESGWQGNDLRQRMLERLLWVVTRSPGYQRIEAGLLPEHARHPGLPLLCLAILMGNQGLSMELTSLNDRLGKLYDWTVKGPQATWTALGGSPGALTLLHALINPTTPAFCAALATHSRDPFGLPTTKVQEHSGVPAHEVNAGPPSARDHELASLICGAFDLGAGLTTRETKETA